MKIQFKPINFIKPQNNKYNSNSLKYRYNLSSDTVSFKGKPIAQQVKELPSDAFLSDSLREYILANIDEKDIITLHKEYYAPLLDCKTLDEAKEMYPEFQDVVDMRDLDIKNSGSSVIKQIARGDFKELTQENASLEFLKRYVGELRTAENYEENYFYLSCPTVFKILTFLNISMDKRYIDIIRKQKISSMRINFFADDENRKKYSETSRKNLQVESFVKKMIDARQNPKTRKKHSETMKKTCQNPEVKKRKSKASFANWQKKDYQTAHKIASVARKLACKNCINRFLLIIKSQQNLE